MKNAAKYAVLLYKPTACLVVLVFCFAQFCAAQVITCGAERMDEYLPLIANKKIALVANQTSLVNGIHLLDKLIENNVEVVKVFTLEHGFRGKADAGEKVNDSIDVKTGVPMVSLYGKNKKPSAEALADIDIILFDIQDVGVRFFTYISSLHYIMEGAAESGKAVMVLDRPNPNGHYVDGPVLEEKYKSFVGMHKIPIVHGMTIGEYGKMINGEGWLKGGVSCELSVIACKDYTHETRYNLPIKPSPNLPNMQAIYLYPSICWFEGTNVSVGRGTEFPFQVLGSPYMHGYEFKFKPESMSGAKWPKHKDKWCAGIDLRKVDAENMTELNLDWLIECYSATPDKSSFFTEFFYKLVGTSKLKDQVIAGISPQVIRATWKSDLLRFKSIRKKYLLYPDFE